MSTVEDLSPILVSVTFTPDHIKHVRDCAAVPETKWDKLWRKVRFEMRSRTLGPRCWLSLQRARFMDSWRDAKYECRIPMWVEPYMTPEQREIRDKKLREDLKALEALVRALEAGPQAIASPPLAAR